MSITAFKLFNGTDSDTAQHIYWNGSSGDNEVILMKNQ